MDIQAASRVPSLAVSWNSRCHTRQLFTREALGFLGELLMPERRQRIKAADALLHPFLAA
jgi:hypothetical protein